MYSSSSDSESETVCMKPNQSKLGCLSDSDSDTAVRKANNSKLACSSALQSDDELFPGSDDNLIDLLILPPHIFEQICTYVRTCDLLSLSQCSRRYLTVVRGFLLPVTFRIVLSYNYEAIQRYKMYFETLSDKTCWWIREINLFCGLILEEEFELLLSYLEQFTSFFKCRLNLIRVHVRESEAFLAAVFFPPLLKVISNDNTAIEFNTDIVLSRRFLSLNINFVDYFPFVQRVTSVICDNCPVRRYDLDDLPVFKELKSLKVLIKMKLDSLTSIDRFFIEDASQVFDEPKFPNLRILDAKIDSTFFDYLNYHASKLTHLKLEPCLNFEKPYMFRSRTLQDDLNVPKNCQILRCTGEILSLCTLTDNVKDIHVAVTNNSFETVIKFLSVLKTSSVEVLVLELKNEVAFDSDIVSSIAESLQVINSLKYVSFEGNDNFAGPESVTLLSDELTELFNVINFLWCFGVSFKNDPTAPHWQWRKNKLCRWHSDDV